MIFEKTSIHGAYNILFEKHEDQRGFFGRIFDAKEFQKRGLNTEFVQANLSHSVKKGTIRGIHFQITPYEEDKLIRCIKGKGFNVITDLRLNSPTFGKADGFEISADNFAARYIPQGCANGTQILEDNTDLFYLATQYYSPKSESGIKWNDPFFKIKWPLDITEISEKDQNWKPFDPNNPMTAAT